MSKTNFGDAGDMFENRCGPVCYEPNALVFFVDLLVFASCSCAQ